jgi:hypothetical protein
MKKELILLLCILSSISLSLGQGSLYEPKEIREAYKSETRTRIGVPGYYYWQNEVNYHIIAQLDPASRILKGNCSIQYKNNSPDTMRYLVIKLLPNIHKKGGARDYPVGGEHVNEGMVIDSISIDGKPQHISNKKKFIEYGTNLYVILDKSEKIVPGSIHEVNIFWNYEVVKNGIRNGAFTDSSFFIGYWYPQIAVYDDVYGWDREDYTGKQETYNELGSYDVEISVPKDYIVWATGDLINEEEIFSDHALKMMNKSRVSGKTISIVNSENYEKNNIFCDNRCEVWKFSANDVPDFAWACSNYYCWDANSLKLNGPENRNIWINTVYPPGTKSFDSIADVARKGIAYLSEVFPALPFPYHKHTTFNGINKVAVEYPMMANNSDYGDEESYNEITVHEIAHTYFPFYVLSNERRHAWIDEGWVKLMGELYGESTGIKRENKKSLNSLHIYERNAGTSNDLPLITPSGFMTIRDNFFHSYAKASISNALFLELMEDKGINNPLRKFLIAWKGKHPTPYDFFYYMNNLCNEDLSWFWKPWYFEFNYPDLAIEKGENPGEFMVINKGGMPLPIWINISYWDDTESILEVSIWEWAENSSKITIDIPDARNAKTITLGNPEIPDTDRKDNIINFHKEDLGKI